MMRRGFLATTSDVKLLQTSIINQTSNSNQQIKNHKIINLFTSPPSAGGN